VSNKVQNYFDQTAIEFDAIHTEKRNWFDSAIDKVFRPGMQERFAYVINHNELHPGTSVLDVGCGGGKYGVALAQRGLVSVGIDFAPAMIDRARFRSKQAGVAERCQWLVGDVMQEQLEPADLVEVVSGGRLRRQERVQELGPTIEQRLRFESSRLGLRGWQDVVTGRHGSASLACPKRRVNSVYGRRTPSSLFHE